LKSMEVEKHEGRVNRPVFFFVTNFRNRDKATHGNTTFAPWVLNFYSLRMSLADSPSATPASIPDSIIMPRM